MDITVKANEMKEAQGATIAVASMEFADQLKVRNITIKNSKSGERFVAMPNYATSKVDEEGRTVYKDVCNPITKEAREEIYNAILKSLDDKVEVRIGEKEDNTISVSCAPYEGKNGVAGMARIYVNDNFVINNITIRESRDKKADGEKYYVTYPSYKTNQVDEKGRHIYKNFCYPVNKSAREEIDRMILAKFEEARELSQMPQEKEDNEKSEEKGENPPKRGVKEKLKSGEEKKKEAKKTVPQEVRSGKAEVLS